MDEAASVTIRGIYATALTKRLTASYHVVTPSSAIRDRFDEPFPTAEPAVTIETTEDRLGIGIHGRPETVADIGAAIGTLETDGFTIEDPVPHASIVDGVITETRDGGAVVDLGAREGYLPFDAVDGYVDIDDVVRVQVHEPVPPWAARRQLVTPSIEVPGVIASLVADVDALVAGTPREATELARTTELLAVDPPDDWGIRWEQAAVDCDIETLQSAAATIIDRGEPFIEVVDDGTSPDEDSDPPHVVTAPRATTWVRLGRDGRFTLDDDRRTVLTTLPGHHRIKAGGDEASAAVDFAERLDAPVTGFPFAAVTDQFGPTTGDTLDIGHGKPDGREYTLGTATVTDRNTADESIRVERELQSDGTYDGLDVRKEAGDIAVTTFTEGRWWYPTTYRSDDGDLRGTYLNINTPIELYPDAVRYVDLHVDVVKWPDGTVETVDLDELTAAVESGFITEPLAERARTVATRVEEAVRNG